MDKTPWFTIGRVTGVHGLNGGLRVWSYAQSSDTFRPGTDVVLKDSKGQMHSYTIFKAGPYKKGVLLFLETVTQRNDAEQLKNMDILVRREDLPDIEEDDTWYWQDLIGLKVVDDTAGFLGAVDTIMPTGAHDILVVKDEDRETLIPMDRHFVKTVDIKSAAIHVDLPQGFLTSD